MFCKFCGETIEDDVPVCPACGKDLNQPVSPSRQEDSQTPGNEPEKEAPKKKVWPKVAGIAGVVVLLGVLAIFLLEQFGVKANPIPYIWGDDETTEASAPSEETDAPTEPAATLNPNFVPTNYSVSTELAATRGNDVVATMGEVKLTNSMLQIYYRLQVIEFLNYYGSYVSYVGLDVTKSLGEQPCYYDDAISWEQFFLDSAMEAWQQDQVLYLMAQRDGFQLDAEMEAEFANIPETLETQAKEGGYASAEEMIQKLLGPANTMEGYIEYIRMTIVAGEYYNSVKNSFQPTDEEAKAYFEENQATFAESGITLDCGMESSVRHILISPEISEGASEATEEQWKACLAEAERVLQEWKDGEATEDSFVAMVPTYTQDTGSATTGGLYEKVNPTSNFVENFLEWSVDMTRKPGDTGIVESTYGYHIMYYVSGEPYWLVSARSQLVSTRTQEKIEEGLLQFPLERFDDNIALCTIELS